MDPSNPYFVHHSDQPGHMLVPTKLNGANYPSWSKSMILALTAKNKIGFIDGSIEPPSETEHPTEYALWNQCNSMILSWLTHSVEPDLAKGVVHAKTALQVWEDFKDQFSQKNAPAIYQIQKSLATLSQGTMTISVYFTKLKSLWDELDTYRPISACNQMKAHIEQREEDRMMQFLMGLNDTYNVVRSNILMITPLPNVRQAYSLVNQEEMQRQMTSETTENFSIAAAIQNHSNNFSNKSKNKYCEHCNREGHTIENCRTLNNRQGQPQQHGFRKNHFPATNATNSSQSTHEVYPRDISNTSQVSNPDNVLHGFSTEQLQQLSRALSMMSSNHGAGNKNTYANATEMQFITPPCPSTTNPHPPEQTETSNTHEAISPTPVVPSSIDQPSTNTPAAETSPPHSDPSNISSETTTIPPPRQSTRPKRPPAWHRDFLMSSQAHQSTSAASLIPDPI
ncbi:hypothetical protein ACOSQ2_002115 [Xanthoceras sorbifolium]